MSKTARSRYEDRVGTLKRRRDFLEKRIANYNGKDPSRDKAEFYALDWALQVIEANEDSALKQINDDTKETM